MPKRSSKPRDLNQMAAGIVDEATDEDTAVDADDGKNPAAVELGRRGGKKGGKARAERMIPEQRREAARKGAQKRWGTQ